MLMSVLTSVLMSVLHTGNPGILAWLRRRFTTDLPAGVSEMNQKLVEEAEAGDLPLGSQV